MIENEADGIINEIFQSLLARYQIGLETSKKATIYLW